MQYLVPKIKIKYVGFILLVLHFLVIWFHLFIVFKRKF